MLIKSVMSGCIMQLLQLPETQRRRLVRYYFYNLTYEQIAELERCTPMPIKRSIDRAVKKLRNFFCKIGAIFCL